MWLFRAGARAALASAVLAAGASGAVSSALADPVDPDAPDEIHSANSLTTTEPATTDALALGPTSTMSCGKETSAGTPCITVSVSQQHDGTAPQDVGPFSQDASTASSVPIPEWCTSSTTIGTRTGACRNSQLVLTAQLTNSSGTVTITGQLFMNRWDHTYAATDIATFAHQSGVSSYDGWGDALNASVSGSAHQVQDCTTTSSSFPLQQVLPHHNIRKGEAFFATTATAIGAVGFCTTTWDLVFSVPGYASATAPKSMNDIRCDNAVGPNGFRPRTIGCVVYWYASAAGYSQSKYPTLALHVSRAQGSGLPGVTFAAPLNRTTDAARIDLNRQLACGDAPSIPGFQCDEYPLASSAQGLAAGGSRRSFPGCLIDAPSGSGPSGASACMIEASENNAQGGIMAAFYYDWRVLDSDPYRVLVVP